MIPFLLALAAASPDPACITQSQAIEQIVSIGGEVVGSAHYRGMVTSDMLIFQLPDTIAMFGFNAAGCYVGQIVIEQTAPETGA